MKRKNQRGFLPAPYQPPSLSDKIVVYGVPGVGTVLVLMDAAWAYAHEEWVHVLLCCLCAVGLLTVMLLAKRALDRADRWARKPLFISALVGQAYGLAPGWYFWTKAGQLHGPYETRGHAERARLT